jgi:CrcB protein
MRIRYDARYYRCHDALAAKVVRTNFTLMPHTSFIGFIAVGVGAAIGAWTRWGLTLWLNTRHPAFPIGTFVANAVGGLLVGLAIAYFVKHPFLSPEWRLLVFPGFLGGLTTFSTYSAEVIALVEQNQIGWALAVGASHLFVSLLLTALGLYLGRLLLTVG